MRCKVNDFQNKLNKTGYLYEYFIKWSK